MNEPIQNEQAKLMRANDDKHVWANHLREVISGYNKSGMKILEVGINGDIAPGGHTYLFPEAEYTTLDIVPELNPTYVEDIRHTSLASESFDCILFLNVLEHILSDRASAIRELYRLLKQGGLCIISYPMRLDLSFEFEPAKTVSFNQVIKEIPVPVTVQLFKNDLFIEFTK